MTAKKALDRTIRLIRDAVTDDISDDAIVKRLQSFRVRFIADEANLRTHAGQTALVTLVSLVVRMGIQVDLDIPEVEIIGPQPPLRGKHLRAALVDFGADGVPGTAVTRDGHLACGLVFVLGDTPTELDPNFWRVTGSAWAGHIARGIFTGERWGTDWPIGGMVAAVLAASEVFKTVVRTMPLRPVWDEYLAPCDFATWDFEGDGLILPENKSVKIDVISAGAITQATLYALFRLPIKLAIRIFDDDDAELSNINRQMLFRRSDSGAKVDIATLSAPTLFVCTPILERFSMATSAQHLPLAPHVLVGVDDIPSRWEVQRATQGWVGIGATTHFEASISSHEAQQPCAGCLHPIDDPQPAGPIPTVSFVSFWAGLALAVRFLRHVGGLPHDDRQQHLWVSSLRMDMANAALWRPVAGRKDCPTGCLGSRILSPAVTTHDL
ncbi:MAG: ThiF family adenylyltransferase [Sulfuricaulis sp.]|uniref:ThiF family adenylyltransferase n=1 Tax=Sulfuricaulis sp. TaxID=2003553 RepID=UPI0025DF6BFE|nr:ThiF family adenylyltransferase [Sulfuricaulis sp.]MCR4347872.1 ThiF family adenylyltransferase [Sulfuricaulis sp.]